MEMGAQESKQGIEEQKSFTSLSTVSMNNDASCISEMNYADLFE